MRTFFATVLLTLTFSANAEILTIANGDAQIELPSGYRHYFEDGQKTVVVLPSSVQKAEIRFSYYSMREYLKNRPSVGKDFVQSTAQKKGKTTFALDANAGIAFIDFTKTNMYGKDRVQETFGMMGLNDAYVTFTISIAEDQLSYDSAKQLLEFGYKRLLSGVRSRGP